MTVVEHKGVTRDNVEESKECNQTMTRERILMRMSEREVEGE
jgi:hypothetical protein